MMKTHGIRAALAGLALALAGTAAAAERPATHEYELDNGLTLIVQEDHRAPVAVVQVWYRVGSAYEHEGITGVSHALEHMMFKQTDDLASGEFSEIVSRNGGRENAFTSADYTAYYQEWGAENVALSFKLEADRMRDLVLDPKEFEKEIAVVAEERKLRTDDNPQSYAFEVLKATAYETSPYRNPVIGWASDIEHLTHDDLERWYRQHYAPNNATVVVVGDVVPDEVHALAQKHFGLLAPEQDRRLKPRGERPQYGSKRVTIARPDVNVESLMIAFKAPTLPQIRRGETTATDADTYALDVATSVLGGDNASRLYELLVRERGLATSVSAGYSSVSRLESLLYIIATPTPGTSLAALELAVLEEIEALVDDPPNAEELERVKAEVIASEVFQRDSPSFQANVIGSLESVGLDHRLKDSYVDSILAVDAGDVSEAVSRYLVPQGMTVAYLKKPEDPS